jgi:hypothetical protein
MKTYISSASDAVGLRPRFLSDFNEGLGFLTDRAIFSGNSSLSEIIAGDGLQTMNSSNQRKKKDIDG